MNAIDPQGIEHVIDIPHLVRDTLTGETIEVEHLDQSTIDMVLGDRFTLYSITTVEQVIGFTPRDLLHYV